MGLGIMLIDRRLVGKPSERRRAIAGLAPTVRHAAWTATAGGCRKGKPSRREKRGGSVG